LKGEVMHKIKRADFNRNLRAVWEEIDEKPTSVAMEWVLNMVELIGRGEAVVVEDE
jgi:hypothetical protein